MSNTDVKLNFKKNVYPQSRNPDLPRMFFVSLWVGSRGSGKTYTLCKLLKMYENSKIYNTEGEEVSQRIILFSPTSEANPVFTSLKYLDPDDIYNEYSDDLLLDVVDEILYEREQTKEYQRKMKLYKKFLKIKNLEELTNDELLELESNDFNQPQPPKYPNGCTVFMIFDDLIGSSAFKSTGRSALTNLSLKNRHLQINMLFTTQNLKSIPKSIRTNTSLFVIFKFASKKIILEDLYEEVSNVLTLEKFEEMFEYATREPHNSMVLDFTQNDKSKMFNKNFTKFLNIK